MILINTIKWINLNEKNVTTKGVQNYCLIFDYDKSKSYDSVFNSQFFLLFQDANAEIFVDIDRKYNLS